MRDFLDDDLKKQIKPGIIVATFTVFLIFFLINLNSICAVVGEFIGTIKYLFYGIVIAYVLNQPIRLIESLI